MHIIGVDFANGEYGAVIYGRFVDGEMVVERTLRDGEPCSHRGCLSHISHPCEGCGRIAGRAGSIKNPPNKRINAELTTAANDEDTEQTN